MTDFVITDTLKLDIKSFGFDKNQTAFLEDRVFKRHSPAFMSIYDRVRYNVKTFSLNNNVDIDLKLDVDPDADVGHIVSEKIELHSGSAFIARIENKVGVMPDDAVLLTSRNIAVKFNELLTREGCLHFYGDINNDGVVINAVDLQFVKKFFSDFIIDMEHHDVQWRVVPTPGTLMLRMVSGKTDILEIEIGSPNQKYK